MYSRYIITWNNSYRIKCRDPRLARVFFVYMLNQQEYAKYMVIHIYGSTGREDVSKHLERWRLQDQGIEWNVTQNGIDPHEDHLEMSGKRVSVIFRYGVNQDGKLILSRKVIWPTLRTIPNDTHGSLIHDFELESMPSICINGNPSVNERPVGFQFSGLLNIRSKEDNGVMIERTLFPSTSSKSVFEKFVITNTSDEAVSIKISPSMSMSRKSVKGVAGIYLIDVSHDAASRYWLGSQESCEFSLRISARHLQEKDESLDIHQEEEMRSNFINQINQSLRLETPDLVLNQMFAFAKLRAAESIFETKNGPMHGPGGDVTMRLFGPMIKWSTPAPFPLFGISAWK